MTAHRTTDRARPTWIRVVSCDFPAAILLGNCAALMASVILFLAVAYVADAKTWWQESRGWAAIVGNVLVPFVLLFVGRMYEVRLALRRWLACDGVVVERGARALLVIRHTCEGVEELAHHRLASERRLPFLAKGATVRLRVHPRSRRRIYLVDDYEQ